MSSDEGSPYIAGRAAPGDARAAKAAQSGRLGAQRLLFAGYRQPTPRGVSALGLVDNSPVALRRRLVLLDDRPVEIADSSYPPHIAAEIPELVAPTRVKGGVAALLDDHGYRAVTVRETISTRLPADEEADLLKIETSQPVLILERTSLSMDGQPFEYAVMVMVGAGRELRYDRSV